mmetsp:Transcript_5380/g.13732  ORF Transcript_5380/g.13732 Transcript_5380/m.13732 type:complete len:141 (-) Transcript_5380:374-796(-)
MSALSIAVVAAAGPAVRPSGKRAANARSFVTGAPLRLARPATPRALVSTAVRAAAATEESLGADTWNKSYYPTGQDTKNVKKQWYIVDAEGQTLGRLATMVATYIRGKNSATYTPSQDMGNYVIVINAEKVRWQGPTINP